MLAGRVVEAVEAFAASENLARWAGRPWPAYPTTNPMLSQAREKTSTADYQAAEQRGKSLTVGQLAARAAGSTKNLVSGARVGGG
jgi:hypothetical protein